MALPALRAALKESAVQLNAPEIVAESQLLQRSTRLHWYHWAVVVASLLITLAAWQHSRSQIEEKKRNLFEREAQQTVRLIKERLNVYEEVLRSGVAAIKASGGDVGPGEWQAFVNALDIGSRYPGINGIGVIFPVPREEFASFLALQRQQRPGFSVRPVHSDSLLLPITYIVPVAENAAAVGLDMAHETNRKTAALKARDTGTSQITGPIVLVQDAEKTPGFLFYQPYYLNSSVGEMPSSVQQRQKLFAGLVYAPFVMNKLMDGTLERQLRHVGVTIRDNEQVLYDENLPNQPNYDEAAELEAEYPTDLFGRRWQFVIRADSSFRAATDSNEPMVILAVGITIDALLLLLFLLMARANRRSLDFASRMSEGYRSNAADLKRIVAQLETSNHELEQFAYIASHDLQEPLRTLTNYSNRLGKELTETAAEKPVVAASLRFIHEAAGRMSDKVLGLLNYSRIGQSPELEMVNCSELLEEVLADLRSVVNESGAEVTVTALPIISGYKSELYTLFQNLISNAIKFRHKSIEPRINIDCEQQPTSWLFRVSDNGIGIDPDNADQIFGIFKRLHGQNDYVGSGIGLANCKKVVLLHGGTIWVEPAATADDYSGSVFCFTIPHSIPLPSQQL